MGVTYDQANNKITLTGYSEATPADFDDLYNADIGAVNGRELLNGVIDADPDTFSLDSQPKPADDLAVPIKISCTARGGATCDISGTDAWDNAVSETGIDISSGSATTTQRFKTVDAGGITVNGLQNNDDFDVYQDRWGVVWKNGSAYQFDCKVEVGDESTATWAAFEGGQLALRDGVLTSNADTFIYVASNAVLRLGVLVDEADKITENGCQVILEETTYTNNDIIKANWTGIVYLYSSAFLAVNNSRIHLWRGGPHRMWNCDLQSMVGIRSFVNASDAYNCTISNANKGLEKPADDSTIKDVYILNGKRALVVQYSPSYTFSNITALNNTDLLELFSFSGSVDLVDCVSDAWNFVWTGTPKTGVIYRKYTFNLQVLDKNNNPINTAAVKLVKGATEINLSTDGNGQITQQTLTYGYYDEPNGDTIQDDGDWTLTIQKTGYQTYTKQFTLDEKIDWRVALLAPVAAALTSRATREVSFTSPKRELAFTASGREL